MSKAFWIGFRRGLAMPIGWLLCWLLYGTGHIASKLINLLPDEEGKFERTGAALYRAYQWCMTSSVDVQDRFEIDFGPWRESQSEGEG